MQILFLSKNLSPKWNFRTLSVNVDYTYNDKLELNKISTNTVDYTFEYDVYGNITGIKADNVSVISYEYLANNGNLDKMTYGNNAYVEYTYDELDRIIGVCYNGIESVVYVYSPNGDVATVEAAEQIDSYIAEKKKY